MKFIWAKSRFRRSTVSRGTVRFCGASVCSSPKWFLLDTALIDAKSKRKNHQLNVYFMLQWRGTNWFSVTSMLIYHDKLRGVVFECIYLTRASVARQLFFVSCHATCQQSLSIMLYSINNIHSIDMSYEGLSRIIGSVATLFFVSSDLVLSSVKCINTLWRL